MTSPRFSELNWYGMVVEAWGREWGDPAIAYHFSNGRTFEDSLGVMSPTAMEPAYNVDGNLAIVDIAVVDLAKVDRNG